MGKETAAAEHNKSSSRNQTCCCTHTEDHFLAEAMTQDGGTHGYLCTGPRVHKVQIGQGKEWESKTRQCLNGCVCSLFKSVRQAGTHSCQCPVSCQSVAAVLVCAALSPVWLCSGGFTQFFRSDRRICCRRHHQCWALHFLLLRGVWRLCGGESKVKREEECTVNLQMRCNLPYCLVCAVV